MRRMIEDADRARSCLVKMDAEKFLQIQHQMRNNQEDLRTQMLELDNWEEEMKKKDTKLRTTKSTENKHLPPVRNSMTKKCRKKKVKAKQDNTIPTASQDTKRISGYDYRSWDKFDVESACNVVDDAPKKESSSEYETDEEAEDRRRKEMADIEKKLGNDMFKRGNYTEAIESYTRAMQFHPVDHVLPANRAMALLKQNKFGAAELDCTRSIAMDPTYVKAYFRRGLARVNLDKLLDAKHDFDHVLMFEPQNKVAEKERAKIENILNPKPEAQSLLDVVEGLVKPITKPFDKQSKKPLRRVVIEEIGDDGAGQSSGQALLTVAEQSASKRLIIAHEEEHFHKLVERTSSDQSESEANFEKMLRGDCHPHEYEHHLRKPPGFSAKKPESDHGRGVQITEVPPVPSSSFQFKKDWKTLSANFDLLAEYIKQIDPKDYKRLFAEDLEADMLGDMLMIFQRYYMEENRDVYDEMVNLSLVSRFTMTLMFLSATEKTGIKILVAYLRGKKEHLDSQLEALAKNYS